MPVPPVEPPLPPPVQTLPYPWPILIKSTNYVSDSLGNPAADVVITWADVEGAASYEVRISKL